MTHTRLLICNLALGLAGALAIATGATAGTADADAQARYRMDMAVCNSGRSNQDIGTCRLEARNALAEAKRGGQPDTAGQLPQNALQRCSAHQGADRSACEARMGTQATVSGSVAGGGILRETVTVVPAK